MGLGTGGDSTAIDGSLARGGEQLDKLPPEIRFDEAHAGEKLLKLNHQKKRFQDRLKVFVCKPKSRNVPTALKAL